MYRLGELLRTLRKNRGFSQEQLAVQARVTVRTLQYWEANQQQPRDVELESVLKALQTTPQDRARVYALLTEQRIVRLGANMTPGSDVPTSLLGPLPGIGDLLRALRVRRGWTQEQLAAEMQINRVTVIRWEATRMLPFEEDMQRLCLLLQAAPEEQAALQARRLSPSSWPHQLTLEACREQFELLLQIRSGDALLMPLADLHMLALKRQLRFLLSQSSEALLLLAKLETHHSWWLYMHGRTPEACAGNWRALNLTRWKRGTEEIWTPALNLLSAHAAGGVCGPENAVRLLHPWLRLLSASSRLYLLCDMALYAGLAQQPEEAASFLKQAQQTLHDFSKADQAKDWYYHWYYRMTHARVLLSGGRPYEALERLPNTVLEGDGSIMSLTIWAETCLAAGETNMASHYICLAQASLAKMPLPQRQSKIARLARRL